MSKRMDVGLPDKLELRNEGSGMEISWRWFGWSVLFMTVFAVFWDGFLFVWYSIALSTGPALSLMTLFPIIHVAIGVGITYSCLACWINRTSVKVNQGRITVRHGPLPWIGNKELDAASLKQLYTKEKVTTNRNSTTTTYEVHVLTANGRNVKLVSGLEFSEQALYIEQEIERYFRIEDVPVRGQIGE